MTPLPVMSAVLSLPISRHRYLREPCLSVISRDSSSSRLPSFSRCVRNHYASYSCRRQPAPFSTTLSRRYISYTLLTFGVFRVDTTRASRPIQRDQTSVLPPRRAYDGTRYVAVPQEALEGRSFGEVCASARALLGPSLLEMRIVDGQLRFCLLLPPERPCA